MLLTLLLEDCDMDLYLHFAAGVPQINKSTLTASIGQKTYKIPTFFFIS